MVDLLNWILANPVPALAIWGAFAFGMVEIIEAFRKARP